MSFLCFAVNPYAEGVGTHGPKGARPASHLFKQTCFEAQDFGFEKKGEIEAVRNYLDAQDPKMSLLRVSSHDMHDSLE
jgi:hypothetical protein